MAMVKTVPSLLDIIRTQCMSHTAEKTATARHSPTYTFNTFPTSKILKPTKNPISHLTQLHLSDNSTPHSTFCSPVNTMDDLEQTIKSNVRWDDDEDDNWDYDSFMRSQPPCQAPTLEDLGALNEEERYRQRQHKRESELGVTIDTEEPENQVPTTPRRRRPEGCPSMSWYTYNKNDVSLRERGYSDAYKHWKANLPQHSEHEQYTTNLSSPLKRHVSCADYDEEDAESMKSVGTAVDDVFAKYPGSPERMRYWAAKCPEIDDDGPQGWRTMIPVTQDTEKDPEAVFHDAEPAANEESDEIYGLTHGMSTHDIEQVAGITESNECEDIDASLTDDGSSESTCSTETRPTSPSSDSSDDDDGEATMTRGKPRGFNEHAFTFL